VQDLKVSATTITSCSTTTAGSTAALQRQKKKLDRPQFCGRRQQRHYLMHAMKARHMKQVRLQALTVLALKQTKGVKWVAWGGLVG
jgi:hypothetical protein